jgi:hypothetical protein
VDDLGFLWNIARVDGRGQGFLDGAEVVAVGHPAPAPVYQGAPPLPDDQVHSLQRPDVLDDGVLASATAGQLGVADAGDTAVPGAIFEDQAVQQRAGRQRDRAQVGKLISVAHHGARLRG